MASIQRHGKRWRAYVDRQGVRRSKVCDTRREAQDWAARTEYEILHRVRVASRMPLRELLDRYAREVSPAKRGHRFEALRLAAMGRDKIGAIRLGDLDTRHIADWRDRRLREVAPGSVRRELVLLSSVLNLAVREWQVLDRNPASNVRPPQEPPARTRLPTDDEMERLAYVAGDDLSTVQARVWLAFRFACETAMRSGEIVGLTWERVDLGTRVAHLPITKNGDARSVPLSSEAVAVIEPIPWREGKVFRLSDRQRDAVWRKLRARAGVEGLRWHDSRAAGTVKLAQRLDVLDLARVTGHRDLRILLTRYYRATPEDIAKRLG